MSPPDNPQNSNAPGPPDRTSSGNPPPLADPAGPPRRARRWPWVLAGLILVLATAGLLLYPRAPKTQQARAPPGGAPPARMVRTALGKQSALGVFVPPPRVLTPVSTGA